ncbi:MAG: hypothetical protein HGB08_02720 [Candidatus Moranbacteria bacterium]|nr:hypothetical protein [Candidatus Moranbacteria bacterium]
MKKKIGLSVLWLAIVLLILAFWDVIFFPISNKKLDFVQRFAVDQINKNWAAKLESMPKEERKVITYDSLIASLNPIERKFVKRIFAIKPSTLGFKGPEFSKDPVTDLARIDSMTFVHDGNEIDTGINFFPKEHYADFQRMMEAMRNDIGKELYISSGYRSPGYQAYLFFYYLGPENGYSLDENAKWIAMPGYSEHGSPNTAADLINADGVSGQDKGQTADDFYALPEFAWLNENAAKYDFYQTYPKGNDLGVSDEPWHWHWEQK